MHAPTPNLWRIAQRMGAGGGGGVPLIGIEEADIFADFTSGYYYANDVKQPSFAAWLTALGGTFTRSSSATYIDNGVVKTATANAPRFPAGKGIRLTGPATNLLLASQDFTNAQWAKPGLTIVTGIIGPDGSSTAQKIVEQAGGGQHNLQQSAVVVAGAATYSIFAKMAERRYICLQNNIANLVVDLSNGNVVASGGIVGSPYILALANGWYLISFSVTETGANTFYIYANPTGALSAVWNGDGTSGIYVWGGQVTQTAFLCDYIPTTTATVAQAADDLHFPFTQTTFSALVGMGPTPTASGRVLGADSGVPIAVNTPTQFITANGPFLLSPTVPDISINSQKVMVAGNTTNRWLTADGLVPVTDATAVATGITTLDLFKQGGIFYVYGNCSQLAIWNNLVAPTSDMIRLTGGTVPSWLPLVQGQLPTIYADYVGNHYWAGSQKADFAAWMTALGGTFTRSSSATYIDNGVVKTATANTPRFPAGKGLRLTGPATNLCLQSQNIGASPWYVAPNLSVSSGVADPAGGNNAQTITATASGPSDNNNVVAQSATGLGAGIPVTVSLWMRRRTGSGPLTFIKPDGSGFNPGIITSSWAPYSFTGVSSSGGNATIAVEVLTGGDQIDVFGAQITATAFPCDYIPTTTATVTQAADDLHFPFTQQVFSILTGTNNLLYDSAPGQQRIVDCYSVMTPLYYASSTQISCYASSGFIGGPPITDIINPHKSMTAGDASNVFTTSDGILPIHVPQTFCGTAPTSLYIGAYGSGLYYANGNYSQFGVWNGLVAPPSEMQRLTT
jgi:hypothetical protein